MMSQPHGILPYHLASFQHPFQFRWMNLGPRSPLIRTPFQFLFVNAFQRTSEVNTSTPHHTIRGPVTLCADWTPNDISQKGLEPLSLMSLPHEVHQLALPF